jgi:hypothetical protein
MMLKRPLFSRGSFFGKGRKRGGGVCKNGGMKSHDHEVQWVSKAAAFAAENSVQCSYSILASSSLPIPGGCKMTSQAVVSALSNPAVSHPSTIDLCENTLICHNLVGCSRRAEQPSFGSRRAWHI